MPFKSKAQQRYMFAAESRGDLKKGTAREFAKDTDFKKIPERVKKAARTAEEMSHPAHREIIEEDNFKSKKMKHPELRGRIKEATMSAFWEGFEKEASGTPGMAALELAGLGALAIPSAAGLAGHKMKDHHKDLLEVGGLGVLAAPYAKDLAVAGMGKLRSLRGLKNFGQMAMRIR